MKKIQESARETPVVLETDVLVVGAGPAGLGAALAAARQGCQVCLVERYGYAGGLASGGLVVVLDDWTNGPQLTVGGIAKELVERLLGEGAAVETAPGEWPAEEEEAWWRWAWWGFEDHYSKRTPKPITYAVSLDAEALKSVGFDMLEEAGVSLRFHSLVTDVIVEEGRVRGVIAESKEGRQALLGRVIVDASGDGDVMALSGAAHHKGKYLITLAHRLGGIEVETSIQFVKENPPEARRLNREVRKRIGASWDLWWLRTVRDGIVWCNCPHLVGYDGLKVEDLTRAEAESRRRIRSYLAFARENVPGFEGAYLLDTAPQIGVRQTRLLDGEYVVTKEDILTGRPFDDAVARGRNYYIPYRAFLPKRIKGLLVAGRCYSATEEGQRISREIPPCMAMGQAAGAAAALAIASGQDPGSLDVKTIRQCLCSQGAII